MKRFAACFTLLCLIALCAPLSAAARDATVTVMVYMDASDLEPEKGSATADINEMLYASLSDSVNLILCAGGTVEWQNSVMNADTNEYYQIRNSEFIFLKDAGRKDMTRPSTLTGFIRFCRDNYPADRYILIMWNHGGGALYGFGLDDRFGASRMMSVAEVGQAVKSAGVHFDIVGFDACMMATVEMAAALADSADYLIASEEMEPGVGWYYTDWLGELSLNPGIGSEALGRKIVDRFMAKALEKDSRDILTMSMVNLDVFREKVLPLLWSFAKETSGMIGAGQFAAISRARRAARSFGGDEYDQIDLSDFASRIGTDTALGLAGAVDEAVVFNHITRNMEGSHGLAIYFPYRQLDRLDGMIGMYKSLSFDRSYTDLISSFATVQASGRYDETLSNAGWYDAEYVTNQEQYLEDHRLDGSELMVSLKNDSYYALVLNRDDWDLIVDIQLQAYMDDGKGYIELGSDDEYSLDSDGDLIVDFDGTWIALDGATVPYYAEDYVADGDYYCYTGKVPVTWNGRDAYLILTWDSEHDSGYVRGVRMASSGGASGRGLIPLRPGDRIHPVCRYYNYDGSYDGDYLFGDGIVYQNEEIYVSYEPVGYDKVAFRYMLEDIYGNQYWTEYLYSSDGG